MLNKKFLLTEGDKCLLCKIPKCKMSCPINTEIPTIVELFKNDDIEKAGEILFKNNPLSLICSIVCYHNEQCYGNCILTHKGDAVKFYEIEKYISSKYLYETNFKKTKNVNKRVAIIGGGPAGISMAFYLSEYGYDITIFEKNSNLGGVLKYGIPDFRLDKNILNRIEKCLLDLDVKIKYNCLIGPYISIDKLFFDGYDSIFISTGVWEPKTLNIKGETLGHVHYAIDYLISPQSYKLGENTVVIGGGNVAIDAARTSRRNGSNVTIVYRKDFNHMPASKTEIKYAKDEGINFLLLKSPKKINDDSIDLYDVEKINLGSNNFDFKINKNTHSSLNANSIIIAISQGPKKNIISTCEEIKTNKDGLIICNEFGETSKKGVFASGDVVSGGKTVVDAINNSKIVSKSIHNFLKKQ